MKIVYALPFEPLVWSRSILGLGLPISANGHSQLPLAELGKASPNARPAPRHWFKRESVNKHTNGPLCIKHLTLTSDIDLGPCRLPKITLKHDKMWQQNTIFHCLTLTFDLRSYMTYNLRLAKVKVDPRAKNQGQRSNSSNLSLIHISEPTRPY